MSTITPNLRLANAGPVGGCVNCPPGAPAHAPAYAGFQADAASFSRVRPHFAAQLPAPAQLEMQRLQHELMTMQAKINLLLRGPAPVGPGAVTPGILPTNCCLCCPSGCQCPGCCAPNQRLATAPPCLCCPSGCQCPGCAAPTPRLGNAPPACCLPGFQGFQGFQGFPGVQGAHQHAPRLFQTVPQICLPGGDHKNCAPGAVHVCLPGDRNCAPGSVKVSLPGDPNAPDGSLELCVPGDPGCDPATGLRVKKGNQPTQLVTPRLLQAGRN